MANVHEVHIAGWMPFDIGTHRQFGSLAASDVVRGPLKTRDEAALIWLGRLNSPSWGLRIEYGKSKSIPNEHGGRDTYFPFTISGQEALHTVWMEKMVHDLVHGGAIVTTAQMCDFENSSPYWSLLGPDKFSGDSKALRQLEAA